jgi:hypothetical protein
MSALDPVVYFFLLGALAGLLRADLRLPQAIYEFISALLLLAIGLKGGVELSRHSIGNLAGDLAAVIALGVALALLAFAILRVLGRLERADAGSIAAHYGSVSVGTFAVAVAYLGRAGVSYEPQVALYLVVLEVPAIFAGILLARGLGGRTQWLPVAHEVLLSRSILLLLGGLAIGRAAGQEGIATLSPLFVDLFKGVLALFLLEMGMIATEHLGGLRRHGLFLAVFAVAVPLLFSTIGALAGLGMGLSVGGTTLLATLAGSASYIAAPAAMRTAVPEANPSLSLTASLAITFPFNILFGIPAYHAVATWLHAWHGGAVHGP